MSNSSISEYGSTAAAIRKVTGVLVAAIVVLSALSFAGVGGYHDAYAQDNRNNNNNNNNLDVQVTKPSSELTAQWWQWASSFPRDENPISDTTGEDCSKGDFGDIFFLGGGEGGKVERDCIVTEGQAILIPIVTVLCFNSEGETQESLLAQCTEIVDQTKNPLLIIDGNKVRNLESYRVTNPSFFTVDFPENNIFEPTAAGSYDAVADGYWVLIEGLSAGEHDITVVGKLHGQSSFGKIDFRTQVTYHLTVE